MQSELEKNEKIQIVNEIFPQKNSNNTITNIGNHLINIFDKIDGFDRRWNSLITSSPLLFEDIDYLRVKPFVNQEITDYEIEAYKRGDLSELYATFENMLMCNIIHYNRIMSFCTMVFLNYVRLETENQEIISKNKLEQVVTRLDMTPTQIWCAACSSSNSTKFELEYGWNVILQNNKQPYIETNWKRLINDINFNRFVGYCNVRVNQFNSNFRETYFSDKIDNNKLGIVCSKFLKTSTAFSEKQLDCLVNYVNEIDILTKRVYNSIYDSMLLLFGNNQDKQFTIFVFIDNIRIVSSKFIIQLEKVKDEKTGKYKISKKYEANPIECFLAEEYLLHSAKILIEWSNYEIPSKFDLERNMLKTLLKNMLTGKKYKEILCVKRMNEYGVIATITFNGCWSNIRATEKLMSNNELIHTQTKVLSLTNMVDWLIDKKGYFLFGIDKDVLESMILSSNIIKNHYSIYCISVINYLRDIIELHKLSKNEIIDIVIDLYDGKEFNPKKLNNKDIKYTELKSNFNPREIMLDRNKKKNKNLNSYWSIINK